MQPLQRAMDGSNFGSLGLLPVELVQSEILLRLDGASLARLEAVSTAFRGSQLSTERAAQAAVLQLTDAAAAGRFR